MTTASRSHNSSFAFCLVLAALLLGESCWAWQQLPAGPVNYFALGSFFFWPGLVLFYAMVFRFTPSEEPRGANLPIDRSLHRGWRILFLIYLTGAHSISLWVVGLDHPWQSGPALIYGGMGVLCIVMGNQLGKCRINSRFRVRTPWTLRSELSWNRTNRLAGRMVVVFGLSLVVVALAQIVGMKLPVKWIPICELSYMAVLLITIYAYSYFLWRSDPEKTDFCPPCPRELAG